MKINNLEHYINYDLHRDRREREREAGRQKEMSLLLSRFFSDANLGDNTGIFRDFASIPLHVRRLAAEHIASRYNIRNANDPGTLQDKLEFLNTELAKQLVEHKAAEQTREHVQYYQLATDEEVLARHMPEGQNFLHPNLVGNSWAERIMGPTTASMQGVFRAPRRTLDMRTEIPMPRGGVEKHVMWSQDNINGSLPSNFDWVTQELGQLAPALTQAARPVMPWDQALKRQ